MSDELRARRERALAPSYQLFYDDPVHLVRGSGVWMFDQDDRRYLDCYNNVASVGHCHPHVVEAISRQVGLLNTHTRYLHENVVQLAERLGASLGGDLSVCYFVCTGTEAIDLAVEIARAVTGNEGAIVTERSYHGNSSLVWRLSTDSYPDEDRPDWLGVVEPPNTYRGPYRVGESPDSNLGAHYADLVHVAVDELGDRGHGLAAFLLDSSWDSNGVLVAPDEYVQRSAEIVRSAGGLVIADEVQAGYCRLGRHFWGHENYGLVPDIVVLGKPMGGGHPIGAVITTPEIATAFASRRSYFNTFGGNPVSAAAALAVLDVITDERLLDNVDRTGAHIQRGLVDLAARHDIIGNVQGSGLFWGLDLVSDQATRQPISYADGTRLVTELRNDGILVGLTGRFSNVLKIRPPLPFAIEHADLLIGALDQRLSDFGLRGGSISRRLGAEW
jgi:4-aminobutyrate aminotransferase-like enzyme